MQRVLDGNVLPARQGHLSIIDATRTWASDVNPSSTHHQLPSDMPSASDCPLRSVLVAWPAQLGAVVLQQTGERDHPSAHHELPQLLPNDFLQADQPQLRSRFPISHFP